MHFNNIKIAFRLLWRNRFFTLLNLSGLAFGMAAAILMFLWVKDELGFDRFHQKGAHIYRVLTNWKFGDNREWTGACPAPLTEAARHAVPGISQMIRMWNVGNQTLGMGANWAELENIHISEKAVFEIFDFKFVAGTAQTALSDPKNVVLTQSAAIKVFGKIPALGASLHIASKGDYQIGAVLEDLPGNSSIQFDALLPWETNAELFSYNPQNAFNWGQINYKTWVLLRPDAKPDQVAKALSTIAAQHRSGDDGFYFSLQNIYDIRLYSGFLRWGDYGSLSTIRLTGLIGLLVLLIACINYVNLTTAHGVQRAKNVGIRKTLGAAKAQLFGQSMLESGLVVGAAMVLAGSLAWTCLPYFEKISGKTFSAAQIVNEQTFLLLLGIALLSWLMSGIQPAMQMVRFQSVAALKGEISGSSKNALHRFLVIGQFVFSIGLGICALLIFQQLKFVREKNLGFDREHMFMVFAPENKAQLLKQELQKLPEIQSVSVCDNPFVNLGSQCSGDDWEGKTEAQSSELWQINVDSEFPEFFGLELAAGRWFRPGNVDSLSFVINESAAKQMGLKEPIGKWINHGGLRGSIVGVAKDFHFQSLHHAIEPMIFSQFNQWYYVVHVKTLGANTAAALAGTEALFHKIYPERVFNYEFLDAMYDDLYQSEVRTGQLTGFFTLLALLISCLGLMGLATFAAVRRTKEIGIRKVLGASIASVVGLLSKDFLILVLVALLIAAPLAYLFMEKWLSDFAYRIDIQWWVFALAGVVAIGVAFLTVGFQSVKAALANPVDALRSE